VVRTTRVLYMLPDHIKHIAIALKNPNYVTLKVPTDLVYVK
jgi:hypothetical protein